ncbi:MAG: PIN domain-containing protein [Burkholderiales bacterium]
MSAGAAAKPGPWGSLAHGDLVVVDTAPIIYCFENHPEFAPRFRGMLEAYARGAIQIAISTITVAEVLVGPLKRGEHGLAKRYETELTAFTVVPVGLEIGNTAASLRASAGLRLPDALVAATAFEVRAKALVTNDMRFFRLQGLQILTGG